MAERFSGATVGMEELAERIGYEPSERERVRKYLRQNGIPFKDGRRGPWTTVDALNAALGIDHTNIRGNIISLEEIEFT